MRPNYFTGEAREGENFEIQARATDRYGKLHVPGSFDSYELTVWLNGAVVEAIIAQRTGAPSQVLSTTLKLPWRGDSIGYNLSFLVTDALFDAQGGSSYHIELVLKSESDIGNVAYYGDVFYIPMRS